MQEEFCFSEIAGHFAIDGKYVSCVRYGEGHINDTFKLTVEKDGKEVHYILQRINNRLFTDVEKLMRNIRLVTEFCRKSVVAHGGDPMRECLNVVPTKDGKDYYTDGKNYFRVYIFMHSAVLQIFLRGSMRPSFMKFCPIFTTQKCAMLISCAPWERTCAAERQRYRRRSTG